MTLEDMIQGLDAKMDVVVAALSGGVPAPVTGGVDLAPVLAAIAEVKADVEAIKLQVTPSA